MRRAKRERLAKRDFSKAELQNTAQQIMASWFAGKLDNFLIFAERNKHAYRGPTPPRHTRLRNGGTGTPFERPKAKEPSRRDLHRARVARPVVTVRSWSGQAALDKPAPQFFRTTQVMRHPPRRPMLRGVTL